MSCRKKIDSKIWVDYWTMETEVRSLKQELTSTRDALKSATKRCRELVRELDSLHVCHESERNLRDQQLSKILRALLILESRLRQEQKSIRQQLCEKDTVIRNQQIEIARLRRYTKNYLKNKRELDSYINSEDVTISKTTEATDNILSSLNDSNVGKEIQQLKREIIIKLNCEDQILKNKEFGVKKTDSFAGSDVSKESVTSENTDASIVTTTTEGSPSLLSTEGFCEGESSDLSPGSTLNKSSRRIISESDTQVTRSLRENGFSFKDSNSNRHQDDDDDDEDDEDDDQVISQRRLGLIRSEPLEIYDNEVTKISRSDSKDDGMDCNFASDEDDEPIYVNACAGNDNKGLSFREERGVAKSDDNRLNNNVSSNISSNNVSNNNININNEEKIEEEKSMEDTSGNWYSDPDEDRITEEVIQNNSYRPNSNHNSVLECVNQILLRDREEEENVRSIPRTFKHKGRIVRFQPARLSDIESVGSEMERKNSEEAIMDKESEVGAEDEYGMRIISPNIMRIGSEANEEELDTTGAIPIAIIEPQVDLDAQSVISSVSSASPELSVKSKSSNRSSSPILRLERIEEKTCLSMSSKGLTIAKNLDYEDIESLPEIISPLPKTPPALPPKPQFRNNTLVLKKIPSPSFLIDETRKKHSGLSAPGYVKKIFGISTPSKSLSSSSKSLLFDNDHLNKSLTRSPGLNFINNNSFKEGIFRSPKKDKQKDLYRESQKIPRVPNMVRHFEEFKIGSDIDSRCKKSKDSLRVSQFEIEEMDIRQNFEEFNLDECDLSDDPDRPEGDGSDRLGNLSISKHQDDDIYCVVDNNNSSSSANTNSNSNGIYDHFLEATGLSNKSILTPSRLLSNHKSVLKPKDIKYKNKIKAVCEKQIVNPLPAAGINNNHHSNSNSNNNNNNNNNSHIYSHTPNRHWTGPFV
ncbi:putative uncharacterized protein DDB_G0267840 isoform X2 [Cotesia glomerata]|uniref:putative uncharacterized protein DDB_G0267840 isoform X2 n=1 Tax=Cotesia glomerata TaxID=32391 RepID=UPI001D02720C|nr:putative uncharacterized protein DDB_G0267840 isoform X2 [Cotesia glomerata]